MSTQVWVKQQLAAITNAGQWRELRTFDALGPAGLLDGRDVVSYASNDYLGLSSHPAVADAARVAIDRWGTGATASRLVVGTRPIHTELEQALAEWKHTERALVFPTGYAANLGVLTTLGGPDCLIVSDELNHASIIDGCRLSRSAVAIARHNDVDHVDAILTETNAARAIVVADAVFSMDGDEAPVSALAECCARHDALLIVDEAHAVLGPQVPQPGDIPGLVMLRVVTMSKAIGALGGAVCGPADFIDLMVNRARPLIFTTGLSPADSAAALAAIDIVRSPEGERLISRLRTLTDRVAAGHPSPIIPIIVGDEDDAMAASARLLNLDILVPAIRPPTVAPGTARLRVALSAAHTDTMIDQLCTALHDLSVGP